MVLSKNWAFLLVTLMVNASCKNGPKEAQPVADADAMEYYSEPYRPQFHFSPEKMWMNDPNGMVYHKGIYHLFYQYYPDDIVWGPMHWGHATSTDLIFWKHKPIALYPDKLGYIFSGSALIDKENTSGFGTVENPPLVAIYTYHDAEGEKAGRLDYQTQGIAYSLDNGETWKKFEGNPVIGNEGIKDFRDPKVMWHEPTQKWIMTLVAGDHAQFYSSSNLKDWKLTGEFGKDTGAHGGVWECPDLIELEVGGTDEKKWVLLISINPGAPNGGSGTQYFIGDFDGQTFTTDQKKERWIDWGTDNYAGVTWSNAPNDEIIFMGWMSNWNYATKTPTEKWRSAMTVPRKLSLQKIDGDIDLINYPIEQLETLIEEVAANDVSLVQGEKKEMEFANLSQSEIRFETSARNFQLKIGNMLKEEVALTMNGHENTFILDRTTAGQSNFQKDFAGVQQMPVHNLPDGTYEVRILIDLSSIEVFINKGQYAMTAQLFPTEPYTDLIIESLAEDQIRLQDFKVSEVKRIW